MSIALDTKLIRPISIVSVLPKIGVALRDILGLSFEPKLTAEEYVNRMRVSLRSASIQVGSNSFAFELINEPEIVLVQTYLVDYPPEQEEALVSASANTWRTPLEFALAGAVIGAFGRELETPISDSALFYTETFSQSAARFTDNIKVKGSFDDYRTAAQEFYDALPRISAERIARSSDNLDQDKDI